MLRSAYKHFSCLNLAEVTSKNDSKTFKVAPVDDTFPICQKLLALAPTNHRFVEKNWPSGKTGYDDSLTANA